MLPSADNQSDPKAMPKDMTEEEKLAALTQLYNDYNEKLDSLYADFIKKISKIRKEDDLKKVENMVKTRKDSGSNLDVKGS